MKDFNDIKDMIVDEIEEIKENLGFSKRKTTLVNYVLGPNEYKKSFEAIVEIDGKDVKDKEMLHKMLKEKFNFPDYYGENLDALNDLLGEINKKTMIEVVNFSSLEKNIGGYATGLLEVLNTVEQTNDYIKVKIKN